MAEFKLRELLEQEVIDKMMPVIKNGDKALEEKMAKLGTRIGHADTYAGLPTVDQNGKAVTDGDSARLTATDGANPAGMYEWDGNAWVLVLNYDALDIGSIVESAKATQAEFDAGSTDKLATPAEVLGAIAAQAVLNETAYHPKGGDTSLKVVGANADKGTQEFVTANQMSATFTTAEIQAKYDAL